MHDMEVLEERRSARKRRAILQAASTAFLGKGYSGTNMDEIAALAGVSKRTVYQHFGDKDRLFAEIVLATTDEVDALVRLVADGLADTKDLEADLARVARQLLSALMQPDVLRLRRLVIANAARFPELSQTWYERGFGRVLSTLAGAFQALCNRGLLTAPDPALAADHFVGQLLWIPVNEVMFTGDPKRRSAGELNRYADAAVSAFLTGHAAGSASPG